MRSRTQPNISCIISLYLALLTALVSMFTTQWEQQGHISIILGRARLKSSKEMSVWICFSLFLADPTAILILAITVVIRHDDQRKRFKMYNGDWEDTIHGGNIAEDTEDEESAAKRQLKKIIAEKEALKKEITEVRGVIEDHERRQ